MISYIRTLSCALIVGGISLAGCGPDTGPVVPSGAMQMSSGNKIVSFTAPDYGKAYLRDDTDNDVIYSATIRRDQVLKYDPQLQQVFVDGAVAASEINGKNHDHSILFERIVRPDHADAARPAESNGGVDANGVQTIRVPVGVQVDVQPPANK